MATEPDWRTLVGYRSFETILDGFKTSLGTGQTRLTNWNKGGVTRTFFELVAAGIERVYSLAGKIAPQGFAPWATEAWLDEHLRSIGLERTLARRARGLVTIVTSTEVTLSPGHTFATPPNSQGKVYRFTPLAETSCPTGANTVLLEAVEAGTASNVAAGTITIKENVPAGVTSVTNGAEWLTLEGLDKEKDDRAKARYAQEWTDPAGETLEQYESWAFEADGGVQLARAIQVRGPGSIDVLILGPEGAPSGGLISAVETYILARKLLCRDVLVRGPTLVSVNVTATIWLRPDATELLGTVQARAVERAQAVFAPDADVPEITPLGIGRSVHRTGLLLDALKGAAASVHFVDLTAPASEVAIAGDALARAGTVTITVSKLRALDDGSWAP